MRLLLKIYDPRLRAGLRQFVRPPVQSVVGVISLVPRERLLPPDEQMDEIEF